MTYTIVKVILANGTSAGYNILKNGEYFCGYPFYKQAKLKLKELEKQDDSI